MKYDRVILISIDSLGKKYEYLFKDYFTTSYKNYHTTSSWTLSSHLTMLSGLKSPKLFIHKKTIDFEKYEGFVENVPTIATLLKEVGFKSRAITGGGFMSKLFGWGHDWGQWIEAYDEKEAWSGEKMLPKKHEFLFLHTYFVHNWFNANRRINRSFNKIKTLLENKKCFDKKEYKELIKFAKYEYEKRVKALAKRLKWIKNISHNTLVILTSDHAELFSKPGFFHHGNLAIKDEQIFFVPLLVKENIEKKRIVNEYVFDFLLPKLIFDKLVLPFNSIPRKLIDENQELKSTLNKIYNSKTWKLLHLYKRATNFSYVLSVFIHKTYNKYYPYISPRKILKLLHLI